MQLQANDKIANKCWNSINKDKKQYVSLDLVQQWVAKVMKEKLLLQRFKQEIDLAELLRQYIVQECQLKDNVEGVQFKFQEALSFLNWIISSKIENETNLNKEDPNELQDQQKQVDQNLINQKEEENNSKQENQNSSNQQQTYQNQETPQQRRQTNVHDLSVNNQLSVHRVQSDFRAQQIQEKQNNFDDSKQNKPRKYSEQKNINNDQLSLHRDAYSQSKLRNYDNKEGKPCLQQIRQLGQQKRKNQYKHNLRIVFEHYCRLSYAMGQDPTFDQIQHKSQTMTVNKFMIFCRDFNMIGKQIINRNNLVDLFKKYSSHSKQMNFEEFLVILGKIGEQLYEKRKNTENQQDQSKQNPKNNENLQEPSQQLAFLLQFMEIATYSSFKEKMKKLNIKVRTKANPSQPFKKELPNYKFKYAPTNGKTEDQIKQQIQERKNIRSEKKLHIKEKVLVNKGILDRSLNKKQPNAGITKEPVLVAPKKLPPPTPPLKLSKINNSTNFSNNVQGYGNIYKMKQNKTRGDITNSRNRLKLNSIVQQAKKIVHQSQVQSNSTQMMQYKKKSESQYSKYGLYQSQRSEVTTPQSANQYQNDAYLYNLRNKEKRRPSEIQNKKLTRFDDNRDQQLAYLIEGDDQQDDFLKEHLERQKKNSVFHKRLQKKIEALQY